MKFRLVICYLLLGASAALAVSAGYTDDPLKISIGARAMGMGGALAAVSDGPSNIFNNPAGIAGQATELTSMYTSLLGDVNYAVAGGSWPVGLLGRQGNMGVGFAGSSLNGFVDPDPLGFRYFDYRNNVWLLAYGEKLTLLGRDSQAGLRLKYFDEGFSGSQTDSGRGYNLDAGVIVTPWERTDLGLMAQNIVLSALGGKITWASGGEESIPKSVKLGIASRQWRPDVLLAADVDAYLNRGYPARLHGGVEWQAAPTFALRGGIDQAADAGGVSTGLTFGAGLNIWDFVFDYAYHPYFGLSDTTTHYFSLSYSADRRQPADGYFAVTSPPDNKVTVSDPQAINVTVLGDQVRLVRIAGRKAEQAGSGRYTANIPLALGRNSLTIEAFDGKGKILQRRQLSLLKLASFTDVPSNYWAAEQIGMVGLLGVVKCDPGQEFNPEGEISRVEMAACLSRSDHGSDDKVPPAGEQLFSDVPADYWGARAIDHAARQGLVKGYPDGTFRPDGKVTRAEGVILVGRFSELKPTAPAEQRFSDVDFWDWDAPMIDAAFRAGMLKHFTGWPLEPHKNLTRAEAMELIYRSPKVQPLIKQQMLDFGKAN
jgi:hypothetical protein